MQKLFFHLLFIAAALTACGSDDKGDDPGSNPNPGGGPNPEALYLRVTPETLTFDGDGTPADGSAFTVESNGTWQAAVDPGEDWVQLSAASGAGNGSVTVAIPEPVKGGGRAGVTFTARDAQGATETRQVFVVQKDPQEPGPGDLKIDLDFADGPKIADPALPGSSDAALSGRAEYTMDGYPFALFADATVNGKYFWVDNSQYSAAIPEPNKGLYFSKEGAYIEFPAITGKALAEVLYTATTSANGDVSLEICDTDDTMVNHMLDYTDDGALRFTLVTPAANTRYRLEVVNKKNAQAARLVLTYKDAR